MSTTAMLMPALVPDKYGLSPRFRESRGDLRKPPDGVIRCVPSHAGMCSYGVGSGAFGTEFRVARPLVDNTNTSVYAERQRHEEVRRLL